MTLGRLNIASVSRSGRTSGHDNMGGMKLVGVLVLVAAAVVCAAAPPQMTLKVGVDLINVLFTVTDRKGHLVTGLNREDFLIEEDGKKQDIRFFSRENELPLTLGLLIDTSPSVRPTFDQEQAAANRFFETVIRPQDLAMVIGFEKSVTMVQDFTENVRSLQRSVDSLEIGPTMDGGTSLYDAVYLAAREKLKPEAGRKAIILISDGDDTTSRIRADEAMIAVHSSDAVIYSIAIGGGFRGAFRSRRMMAMGDHGTLKRLSEETGGSFFNIDDSRDFDQAFARINEELRNQYSLAFVSSNPLKDGKYRRLKIIPRDQTNRIQARKGYYASKGSDSQ
jgi:VWFA-related protein